MKFCLIGQTLSHSYSAILHRALGADYSLVEVAEGMLGDFAKNNIYDGYNVTIPYKSAIMPYLDALSPLADRLGAVNTVCRQEGRTVGYNTDYAGFLGALDYYRVDVKGRHALVLGTGGAGKMAATALADKGATVTVVSRSGKVNYDNVYDQKDVRLIVNATPVGTFPHIDQTPLDVSRFDGLQFVYDLVYNPYRTRLMLDAMAVGAEAQNGLAMLVIQALEARKLWTDASYAAGDVRRLVATLAKQTLNVALVGMPSAGKSTVGKLVASGLGRPFVDTDRRITERTGRTPRQIIEEDGEDAFREVEAAVVREVCAMRGVVIALGGGAILRAETRTLLKQTAMTALLLRDLSALSTEDRPTLQREGAEALYRRRAPLYRAVQDLTVSNQGTPQQCAQQIIDAYENFGN